MESNRYQTCHGAGQPLPGHRHAAPYLALVQAGSYSENSADGAYRCRAGMAIVHPAWHLHSNEFAAREVRVTNVTLAAAPRYEVFSLSDRHFAHAQALGDGADLMDFVREEGQPELAAWGPPLVREMAEMLCDDPARRIDAVATALGVSPAHATRRFRRQIGMSPAAFRSEHRLRKALRCLRRGEPAADVATDCGYSDQSHLCRAIKTATSRTITDLQRSDLFKTN